MPDTSTHSRTTNLSGNEIYCLDKLSLKPGNICIGNSVYALGILGSLTAGLNILVGGDIPQVTELIHDGRMNAIERMMLEAKASGKASAAATQGGPIAIILALALFAFYIFIFVLKRH